METKKRKTGMNVALFLMAAILAEPCSAYLSPDIGMIFLIQKKYTDSTNSHVSAVCKPHNSLQVYVT
jgi:hypothetical protein